jgi:hypothetical protein
MTAAKLLLLPAFVHVLLVFVLVVRLGVGRFRAVKSGLVKPRDVALDSTGWPDDLRKLANNYENQFQAPVLFYAALALILATGLADGVMVGLAFAFVATRLLHSFIHTGRNVLLHRFLAFVAGIACLFLLWGWFGLRLLSIG